MKKKDGELKGKSDILNKLNTSEESNSSQDQLPISVRM